MAGWQKTEPEHVAFGLVLGSDGKKFKTRSGETEKLIDLLDQAVNKVKAILFRRDSRRRSSTDRSFSPRPRHWRHQVRRSLLSEDKRLYV